MAECSGLPNKQDVARALLLKGTLFVHLDPRCEHVVVPGWLRMQPQLVLQIGLDMPLPIPDLRVDDAGVYGTLSFNRNAFCCSVPWGAVFALVGDDGRGMVWPESMPSEIAAEVEREARRARVPASEDGGLLRVDPSKRKRRPARAGAKVQRTEPAAPRAPRPSYGPPSLQLIAGDGAGASPESARTAPHLRLVK